MEIINIKYLCFQKKFDKNNLIQKPVMDENSACGFELLSKFWVSLNTINLSYYNESQKSQMTDFLKLETHIVHYNG